MRWNKYHMMWVFVLFDLPTETKKERKSAALFRKRLLQNGFSMMQYSVYIRHCISKESQRVHERRVEMILPSKGRVSMISITDKQFSDARNFWSANYKKRINPPQQISIF